MKFDINSLYEKMFSDSVSKVVPVVPIEVSPTSQSYLEDLNKIAEEARARMMFSVSHSSQASYASIYPMQEQPKTNLEAAQAALKQAAAFPMKKVIQKRTNLSQAKDAILVKQANSVNGGIYGPRYSVFGGLTMRRIIEDAKKGGVSVAEIKAIQQKAAEAQQKKQEEQQTSHWSGTTLNPNGWGPGF